MAYLFNIITIGSLLIHNSRRRISKREGSQFDIRQLRCTKFKSEIVKSLFLKFLNRIRILLYESLIRRFYDKIEQELLAIETMIYVIRGQRVMLDSDLAKLYGVETKNLNKAVQRNKVSLR